MKKNFLIVVAIFFAFALIAIQHQIRHQIALRTHERIAEQTRESITHSEAVRKQAIESRRRAEVAAPKKNQAAH